MPDVASIVELYKHISGADVVDVRRIEHSAVTVGNQFQTELPNAVAASAVSAVVL